MLNNVTKQKMAAWSADIKLIVLLCKKALFRRKLPTLRRRCCSKRRQALKDVQWDVDQRDGAEDGRLVGRLEGMLLTIQKSVVSTKATDDGNEDDSEKTKRCQKMVV